MKSRVYPASWLVGVLFLAVSQSAVGDLRIVVDVSRGMHELDKPALRGAAIELLARSMPESEQGGLWAYSQLTQQLVSPGPANDMWQQLMTVHGRNLAPGNRQADPTTALKSATWDLEAVDRGYVDVVWITNGDIDTGATELEHNNARQLLLNTWASKLRQNRIRVHSIALSPEGADTAIELDMLRQVANLSGGIHKVVSTIQEMQTVALDIVRLMQIQPTTQADKGGRFQVTPGVERLTLLWLQKPSADQPMIETPDGMKLSRNTAIPDGRWLLAQDFEMISINNPKAGWWKTHGLKPDQLAVFGDLEIRVTGLAAPVIPTEESHAVIQVFDRGELITHSGFLDLLDVRAWISSEKGRKPLPLERVGEQFKAYFVSLQDGSFEFDVDIRAPTFSRQTSIPFVVSNPLRVDIHQKDQQVNAWLNFTHAEVDYRTVKVSAKVRKPPEVGTIVPGQKLPAGLFQIPISNHQGVVELTFTVGGNYLNGEGFFMKTRRQTVTLPLQGIETMRFTASGRRIDEPVPTVELAETQVQITQQAPGAAPSVVMNRAIDPTQQPLAELVPPPPSEPGLPPIPLWFVGVISVLNIGVGLALWWMNGPGTLSYDLRLREVAAPAT
ncbi:MAG: vWA domain-containing protein [Pseudomonadota bacterium]